MKRLLARCAVVAISLVSCLALGRAPASAAKPVQPAAPRQKFLLALGDSLASGYQPIYGRHLPPNDPASKLPDLGYPGGYARDLAAALHLRLVDLGCPGETTQSMASTPAEPACKDLYEHSLKAKNQLDAALAFLKAHRDQVSLVTIDLGGDNLLGCASNSAQPIDLGCVAHSLSSVEHQLPRELKLLDLAIKRQDHNAELVGMNYYDPFLSLELAGKSKNQAVADESLAAIEVLNSELASSYSRLHITWANVALAFHTYSSTRLVRLGKSRVPLSVASICQLTYMCATDPNIHPNDSGYAVIARAFELVIAPGEHSKTKDSLYPKGLAW